ncbi:tetratricopeptide repeat protein [Gloeothece verrucosa]|uniref:Purine or other phosphorylase family 1 n=1 Tax=Gloeothece verrucosa (strain PCC 7822) TaxID=497965 RepID=E0U8A4_GLOV7|nr:tetratricopeptide repeat protein [Gloeothece verrucosa]ADN12540.1 purine or other phosphorylase family 1 [Gloeothece verrucosa PCC 7822]
MNNLIPPSELILKELGIDRITIKSLDSIKRANYRSVINWLTKYKAKSDASNLEQIRGYLEAFYHLCNIEEWDKASKLLSIRLNTPTNEELHKQLKTWGYYQEQIEIYQIIFKKIARHWDAICLEGLGNAAFAGGNIKESIEYHQKQLEIAQNFLDQERQISALIGSANSFKFLGKYDEATKYYLKILEIAFQIANKQGKMMALGGLGNIQTYLGHYGIAIEYHQQQLNITKDISDNLGKIDALLGLGQAYLYLKNYSKALDSYENSLEIAKKIENKHLELKAISGLGRTYYELEKYELATHYYEKIKKNAREISLPLEEAEAIANLAIVQRELNKNSPENLEKITNSLNESLSIFNEAGNPLQIAGILKELAKTYDCLGDIKTAKKYCQQALEIAIDLKLSLRDECDELITKYSINIDQNKIQLIKTKEIDKNQCESLKNEIDVVIITATGVELKAVLDLLKPYPRRNNSYVFKVFDKFGTYYLGKFGSYKTVVTKCRMGSTEENASKDVTREALRMWKPRAIIMAGIAFGQDSNKQKIGDVLIASEIIFYEKQRVGKNSIPRSPIPPSNRTLLDRFETVHDWNFKNHDNLPFEIRVGSILSGEKLVDEPVFKAKLFNQYPQAIGGEMEGAGLCSAAISEGTAWILVKSICDWADGNKDKKYQVLAANAAASLVHHVLSQSTVLNGIKKPFYD